MRVERSEGRRMDDDVGGRRETREEDVDERSTWRQKREMKTREHQRSI